MNGSSDIVITGLQSWHMAMGGNIVNMAKELARHHRVLFINYAVDRFTLLRQPHTVAVKKYREARAAGYGLLEHIDETLWIYTPDIVLESVSQIKPKWLFDRINAMNMKRFGSRVKYIVSELGFKDFILFTDSDFYRSFRLKEILFPKMLVYYIRDNMIATDFFRYHGARMEEAMIRKADLVVANSEFLASYARKYNPRSYYIGQGCDSELFNPAKVTAIPEEMQKIREQFSLVIGYIGALRSLRIDIGLLEYIAEQRPGWALVLVGPEDENFRKSRLHRFPNVFFTGSRKEPELPGYLQSFDVAINAQVYNEITRGNYPRKIDEYLAMGKPVVATRTEAMQMFSNVVFLAGTPEEYLACIDKAVLTDSPDLRAKRMATGQLHSWENNINELFRCIELVKS
jgi:glycosyltransferase involved in cell wall biosynthesis